MLYIKTSAYFWGWKNLEVKFMDKVGIHILLHADCTEIVSVLFISPQVRFP